MNQSQKKDKNYNGIDVAKFICSLLVVAIHVDPFGATENSILVYLNFGIQQYFARFAVPFFFIASGFFLYKKVSKEKKDAEYSKKYIIRLLKLYFLWTIIYLPISIYKITNDPDGVLQGVVNFLRNFLLVGSYTQLWYLNALIIATIIIVLLYRKAQPNTILIISFVLYLIGLFGNSWFGLLSPLKGMLPTVWSVFSFVKKVIVTTRNGVFFGFLFVSLGICFAHYGNKIEKKVAIVGFILSMVLFGVEVFFLKYKNIPSLGNDIFLFLIPSAFFLFSYCEQVDLQDNKIYKVLRIISSLMFYTHMWVAFIINKMISVININLNKTCINFVAVTIVTLIISYLIYRLSTKEKYRFLRKLYS